MQNMNYIVAYQSIDSLTTYSSWITGLAVAGITFSCIVSAIRFYTEGVEVKEIFNKVGKRLRAGIILILLSSIIDFLKGYFL